MQMNVSLIKELALNCLVFFLEKKLGFEFCMFEEIHRHTPTPSYTSGTILAMGLWFRRTVEYWGSVLPAQVYMTHVWSWNIFRYTQGNIDEGGLLSEAAA